MPEPKPVGRPPLERGDTSTSVCLKLPSRKYDELYRQATAARVSVPELIRRRLVDDDGDDD